MHEAAAFFGLSYQRRQHLVEPKLARWTLHLRSKWSRIFAFVRPSGRPGQ